MHLLSGIVRCSPTSPRSQGFHLHLSFPAGSVTVYKVPTLCKEMERS